MSLNTAFQAGDMFFHHLVRATDSYTTSTLGFSAMNLLALLSVIPVLSQYIFSSSGSPLRGCRLLTFVLSR